MKKDKYEVYKPEAFKYEVEDFTPGLFLWAIMAIIIMVGILILFVLFVMALAGAIGWMKI